MINYFYFIGPLTSSICVSIFALAFSYFFGLVFRKDVERFEEFQKENKFSEPTEEISFSWPKYFFDLL